MKKGELLVGETVLCALYLRGSPFRVLSDRRAWPRVVDVILRERPVLGNVVHVMRRFGRLTEASCLTPAALDWGVDILRQRRAFTFLDPSYPRGWVNALGAGAPPCAWLNGELPTAPAIAVVGSRQLTTEDSEFVSNCGTFLMRHGCALVSGGAVGVDSLAVSSASLAGDPSRCVVVLPHGLDWISSSDPGCYVSVCEPGARFTTGQAMERNALVYSFGRKAIVIRPRFRLGGTWHGAVDALRRRLATIWVLDAPHDPACRALFALGARRLRGIYDLPNVLGEVGDLGQPELFGACQVRESKFLGQQIGA